MNALLAEIENLDQKSYEMATAGVQSIESGVDIDIITHMPEIDTGPDLSLWSVQQPEQEKTFIGITGLIDGKTGDELFVAANDICISQIPECESQMQMLQLMYQQQVRSDCTAYENALKQQQISSQQKLEAAQQALRSASLTQYQESNKYDLGQCAIEFRSCMQTTGGCRDDFSGCASVAASDNTNTRKSTTRTVSAYAIQGEKTTIEIAASTYDTLLGKKPLCESVTKQCVAVADQVWDTFLREAAPKLKNAELIAEDKMRQNCIGNISSCFQQACRDTMDPNDPEGSYDMCLTRPETMLNVCMVPLNACGIDATSAETAEASPIWDFIVARLASMRVNSCTTQVKECLTSEDMCGPDYTQCVGLDTDTIMHMCPYQALVGCQQVYGETEILGNDVYTELSNMVQGIMLNIDNNMLTKCQQAADESMVRVCGDAENCENLTTDDNLGARALEYKICEYTASENSLDIDYDNCRTDVSQITDEELGRVVGSKTGHLGPVTPFAGVLDGIIFWGSINVNPDGSLTTVDEYFESVGQTNISEKQKQQVASELAVIQKNIDMAIQSIEADPNVQFCMTGRTVQGMSDDLGGTGEDFARFPELTKQMRIIIANAALKIAKDNYYQKYDQLMDRMMQDYVTLAERMAEIQGENALDARRDMARNACVSMADLSALPKTQTPQSLIGTIVKMVIIVAVIVVVTVFTAGAGAIAGGAALGVSQAGHATVAAAMTAASTGLSGASAVGAAVTAGTTTLSGVISGAGAAYSASLATSGIIAATAEAAGALILGSMAGDVANALKDDPNQDTSISAPMSGHHETDQWNFREVIDTTFEWDTLVCHKCVKTTNCESTARPFSGSLFCKKWGDTTETCTDIQF